MRIVGLAGYREIEKGESIGRSPLNLGSFERDAAMRRFVVGLVALVVLVGLGQVRGDDGLYFIVDGDTWLQPYSITNTSTGTEKVTRFQLDLSTVTTGRAILFDTIGGTPPPNTSSGQDFAPVSPTDIQTGLVPLVGSPKVPDGATLLDISFTDFDPGETFTWLIDVDPADGIPPSTITGAQMIGSTGLVDFDDGLRLTGFLAAVPGNDDAAEFTVSGIGPIPGGEIPEPSTFLIWSLGLLGLLLYRRKR